MRGIDSGWLALGSNYPICLAHIDIILGGDLREACVALKASNLRLTCVISVETGTHRFGRLKMLIEMGHQDDTQTSNSRIFSISGDPGCRHIQWANPDHRFANLLAGDGGGN